MLSLAEIQSEVLAAVCDVHIPVPAFVEAGHNETHRETRFNIYRNNYYVAVINVLKERFPVTERIVGEEFFKATAREFVQRSPPRGQSNLGYGRQFSKFLESFPPVSDLPYLSDVARLEWARFEAAIAPEQPSVTSEDFSAVDPAHAARVGFELHAAVSTLASRHPIYDIWRTNHEDEQVHALADARGGQSVLITRSASGIEVYPISTGAVDFIAALMSGLALGEALERVGDDLSHQDFSRTLSLLLTSGAIRALRVPECAELTTH